MKLMSKDNFTEQGVAPYGMRHGTITPKGKGYFGDLKRPDGDSSTELSSEFQYEGKKVEYPLIVPTLSKAELDVLLRGEKPTDDIYDKAESWAKSRINKGLSPFASSTGNEKFPVPEASNKFAEGGMASNDMNKLFAEGGMNDEGGTVDPVSGNDVPVGSLQNEVRDDIDAKLSEGEFVIPADVVRYIGLERLMKIRDEAKAGLSRMDEIGQMGNADQVENPEELHGDKFSSEIDDIISEVDGEGGEQNFAAGGVVKVPEAGKDILAKYNIQRTAITNPANDVRLLKNAAGDSLYMTYFNGKPSGRIPKGYSVTDANPASRMTGTTTSTATGVSNPTGVVSTTGGGDARVRETSINPISAPTNIPIVSSTPSSTTDTPTSTKKTETPSTTTDAPNAGYIGDKGQGVNAYGGSITATDTGAVSTGTGGFTLNPDGSVTPNTIDRTVMTVAGIVNPLLGIAARVNNALATSSAKDFSKAIADTMGTNVDTTQPAATAGPTSVGGTGGTAATAASLAASEASSKGMSDAAVAAASQAAADVIVKGGSATEASTAGKDASTSKTIEEAAQAGRDAETAPEVSTNAVNIEESTNKETNIQPTETVTTPIDGIDTTVGSGNDGGDEGAGTGEAGGGEAGGSEPVSETGGEENNFESTGSMTAVTGLGGSFAAKPMEMETGPLAIAKGGLITKRIKKTTPAQKRGIASRK
jgi:hypothetical protein